MTRKSQAAALIAVLMISLLCLGAKNPFQLSDEEDMVQRVEILERQNLELSQQVQDLERRLDILTDRVNSSLGMPSPGASAGAQGAPSEVPALEVVRITPESAPDTRPRGRLIIQHESESSGPAPLPGTNYVPPPDPEAALEYSGVAPENKQPAAPPPTMAQPAPAKSTQHETQDYHRIKELWDGGQKEEAMVLMSDYLKTYPRGAHVDEVSYLLGKEQFARGNNEEAITILRKITEELPDSPYGPDALYTVGLAYLETGDTDHAAEAFREVKVLYPFSKSAVEADKKLASCCP